MERNLTIEKINNNVSRIKSFMYCNAHQKLKIFSRQYYKNIILNIFNNYKTEYSFMFGDFDKLNEINTVYGKNFGDKALYNALSIIKKSLPEAAIISRIAGDEFSIIIPEISKTEANHYKELINENLDQYRTFTSGITITIAAEDSNSTNLAYELADITENEVNILKSKRKSSNIMDLNLGSDIELPIYEENSKQWKNLNRSIKHSVSNHISDLRLSNRFNYTQDDLNKEALYMIEEIGKLIEKQITLKEQTHKISYSSPIKYEEANLLHNIILNNNSINNLSDNDLSDLLESSEKLTELLIRNPLSNLHTKEYLSLFLADEICSSDSSYRAIYFSNTNVKLSNTAYGHDYTDKRLLDTSEYLISVIQKYTSFNNESFSFNSSDNFLIDIGGGNYIFIEEKTNSLENDTWMKIINELNFSNNNDLLKFGYAISDSIDTSSKSSFMNNLQGLRHKCSTNKDMLKHKSLNSIANVSAFKKEILDCVNQFLQNIPNAETDITAKRRFLNNYFIALTNEVSLYKGNQENSQSER